MPLRLEGPTKLYRLFSLRKNKLLTPFSSRVGVGNKKTSF